MIASFGNKVFNVNSKKINTFFDMTRNLSLSVSIQEQVDGKPATYIKGENLEEIKFTVKLSTACGVNPIKEITSWESIVAQKVPQVFILGTKQIGKYKYLLKKLDIAYDIIDRKGEVLAATLMLYFEEFVRQGIKEASKSSGSAAAPGVTTQTASNIKANDPYKVGSPSAAEKSSLKRRYRNVYN